MRVGIDYLPATTHAPGVGRSVRELVRALARLPSPPGGHSLELLEFGRGRRRVTDLGLERALCPVRRRHVGLPRRLLHSRWFPAADTLLGGVDVFHHVLARPPRVGRALQSITLSEVPDAGSAEARRLAEVLRPMDAVLVFSAAAAADVQHRLGVPEARLHVIPVGCDHWCREREPQPLPDEPPTLLVLGAPRRVRHPTTVLAAWRVLRKRGLRCRLHFVGRDDRPDPTLASAIASGADVIHDLPPESALPEVVAGASVLVHLSDVEATAVTPLEAFSFGVPVVGSDLPAFREALAGEATLLDTTTVVADPGVLAEALASALESASDERARARRRALAARFSWRASAEATLAVWQGLMEGRAAPRA